MGGRDWWRVGCSGGVVLGVGGGCSAEAAAESEVVRPPF